MNRLVSIFSISLSILMLIGAIGFNLWLYRAESTAQVDPNDNAFQYSLVDRTNQIWDWGDQLCQSVNVSENHTFFPLIRCRFDTLIRLFDHWVPNWAEGYNLPYYYGHVPQIIIVGSYRLGTWAMGHGSCANPMSTASCPLSLFTYYHLVIYLLLCFFPLSIFLSLRILKLPWLTAGIGALLATQISTDGLYGLDPPSFLWRGWGLSSQLFSAIFLPLALSCSIRWINEREDGTWNIEHRKNNLYSILYRQNLSSIFYLLAVFFITTTTMGHIGMGLMLFLSLPVISLTKPVLTFFNQRSFKNIWEEIKEGVVKTLLLALPPLILLSYWIIPTVLDSAYHNTSFWDPIWKFNSYGAKEVLVNLWNGSLFDWGRLPIYTLLVLIGFFICLFYTEKLENRTSKIGVEDGVLNIEKKHIQSSNFYHPHPFSMLYPLQSLSFLFLFFLLLYFGSTTWGGILNIIPGMSDFHQHRFIVGVHLIGLFLAPIGFMWIVEQITERIRDMRYEVGVKNHSNKFLTSYFLPLTSLICFIFILILLIPPIFKQTLSYGKHNETLIVRANANFANQKNDADLLITTLKELMQTNPGRVFAGRGGSWGKTFRVAETPYFMYLSTYGIPTVLWLPQTWSNNSDTEQYFSEENQSHYSLYNIRYVVTPVAQQPQPFWTLIKQTDHWKLYEVKPSPLSSTNQEPGTRNYITIGSSPSVIFSDKLSFANVIRLWIQSPYPEKSIFPELYLTNKNLASKGEALRSYSQLPHFWMLDEATYQTPDKKSHSLFAQPPVYINPISQSLPIAILSQSSDTDMIFKATVQISPSLSNSQSPSLPVSSSCPTCVVILKQTYHPNWQVTVNGKKTEPISVFPSYVAVRLEQAGTYEIVFSYQPSRLKTILLVITIGLIIGAFFSISYRMSKN